jgi:hypothetical protein
MSARSPLGKALYLLIGISLAAAATNTTSTSAQDCASLAALLPNQIFSPGDPTYTSEEESYYSALEAEITPTCIVQPNNAADVATIINYIRTPPHAGDTLVAIRSGGHTSCKQHWGFVLLRPNHLQSYLIHSILLRTPPE